jgi:acyl carrier protein
LVLWKLVLATGEPVAGPSVSNGSWPVELARRWVYSGSPAAGWFGLAGGLVPSICYTLGCLMGMDALDLTFRLEKQLGIKISQAEGIAVLFDTAGTIHRYLISKLQGEYQQVPRIEPLFKEVADAVNRITGWWRLTSSLDLNRRFSPATRAANWQALEDALGMSLPQLQQPADGEFPKTPRKCDSVISLTYWIVEHHPERVEWFPVSCERTGKMSTHQFSEDEVWAILCECICDALGVKPEEITPDSRMVEDLGMN